MKRHPSPNDRDKSEQWADIKGKCHLYKTAILKSTGEYVAIIEGNERGDFRIRRAHQTKRELVRFTELKDFVL